MSESGVVRPKTGGPGDTWRRWCAPEVIFSCSAAAALSPYLMWYFGTLPSIVQRSSLTFTPAWIWAGGLVAFLAGARLAHRFKGMERPFRLSRRNLPAALLLYIGVAVVLTQVYFAATDVYGTVPILDYISGQGGIDVGVANDQQQYSGVGQLGLFTASLYALNPLVLLALIQWITWRRGSRLLIAVAVLLLSFAHLLNAKRQGLYSALFYLLVGVSMYYGNATDALSALLPWRRSRALTRVCLAAAACLLILAFGYIASIRTQGRIEASTDEIFTYLEYPLVNFEAQCAAAGFGPGEPKLLGPLRNLLPYKYVEATEALSVSIPKRIIGAPSGIYEYIQWCWGIAGVMLYSAALGFIARWLYDRARNSLTYLLAYCYFAVALAMAHSNNQLLILSYGPAPLVWVCCLRFIILSDVPRTKTARQAMAGYARPAIIAP